MSAFDSGNRGGGNNAGKGKSTLDASWDRWRSADHTNKQIPSSMLGGNRSRLHDKQFVVQRIQRHLDLHPEPQHGVQRKAEGRGGAGGVDIPKSGGNALPGGVQSKMGPKLGADLSDVKVHTGGGSAKASEDLNAKAFTVGTDVHFNAGEFDPDSKEGEKLLAHELTHVAQNKKGGVQRKEDDAGGEVEGADGEQLEVSDPDEPAEKEADAKADEIVDGGKEAKGDAAEQGAKVQRRIHRAPKPAPAPAAGAKKAAFVPYQETGFGQPVSIRQAGTALVLKIGTLPGDSAITDVLQGAPLVKAHNQTARGAFETARQEILSASKALAAIKGVDATGVDPGAQTEANTQGARATAALSALAGTIKLASLARCKTFEKAKEQSVTVGPKSAIPDVAKTSYKAELDRQVKLQQDGMNAQTLDEWMVHVDTYQSKEQSWFLDIDEKAREAVMGELAKRMEVLEQTLKRKMPQFVDANAKVAAVAAARATYDASKTPDEKKATKTALDAAIQAATSDNYIINKVLGRHGNEKEWRKENIAGITAVLKEMEAKWGLLDGDAKTQGAILHNQDQGAGGKGAIPKLDVPPAPGENDYKAEDWQAYLDKIKDCLGSATVNSTIGATWGDQITKIRGEYNGEPGPAGLPFFTTNIKITGSI